MNAFHSLINAILVIVLIYAAAVYMRRKGVLTEDHSLTLARIVTDLCLPAIVFVSLAGKSIRLDQLAPAVVMLGLELTCIAVAWVVPQWPPRRAAISQRTVLGTNSSSGTMRTKASRTMAVVRASVFIIQ